MTVSLHTIQDAAAQIHGQVVETPCVAAKALSRITEARISLKLENLQFTGSFKDRGALAKLCSLGEQARSQGVIAMSAGNHAQAVAHHAQRLGIPALIVMPRYTPSVKLERTRSFGAEVILHGDSVNEAGALAQELAVERHLTFVHPYDDPEIIAGQGTIGLEMLHQSPHLEVLVVPIGGGGLISGVSIAAKGLRPEIEVIGVETQRFPAMLRVMEGQEPEFGPFSIADGIAIKIPGTLTREIVRQHVDQILLVDEPDIEAAVLMLLEEEKTVAEGAGAVGLAAVRRYPEQFVGRRVGIVLSGGNIDLPILSSIIQRGLVNSGRLVQLTLELRDVPGTLAKAAETIARTGANVVQVSHRRIFTELPLQSTAAQFVLQTRGAAHVAEIVQVLGAAGYPTHIDYGVGA